MRSTACERKDVEREYDVLLSLVLAESYAFASVCR